MTVKEYVMEVGNLMQGIKTPEWMHEPKYELEEEYLKLAENLVDFLVTLWENDVSPEDAVGEIIKKYGISQDPKELN